MSKDQDQYSERPPDSDFQQQNLKAWQPLLTPRWVIGTFLAIAIIFGPIGALIIVASNSVSEAEMRYSDLPCMTTDPMDATGMYPSLTKTNTSCWKQVNLTVNEEMVADDPTIGDKKIYFYYKLTNFYQNHRRYVKSRSDAQLRGEQPTSVTSCAPLGEWQDMGNCDNNTDCPTEAPTCHSGFCTAGICNRETKCVENGTISCIDGYCRMNGNGPAAIKKTLYPCGLIANSYFNDTFIQPRLTQWTEKGIAWESDIKDKFKPLQDGAELNYDNYTRVGPGGYVLPEVTNEPFIVWMRTAGLPTFKKLRYIISNTTYKAGENVTFYVYDTFPSTTFEGEKFIVLSTTSWLGGKNLFLGYAYITVAALCFFFAVVFSIKHCMCPRELGDMKYFNWDARNT